MMKFKFDPNQAYQWRAIQSVIDLFVGQHTPSLNNAPLSKMETGNQLTAIGLANQLSISNNKILSNLKKVQQANGLPANEVATNLGHFFYTEYNDDTVPKLSSFLNFSVEMETGTGKTYVYLRTIFELHKHYGFKKFVIVVPSVAIREGVLKTLSVTFHHFQQLYASQPMEFHGFDAGRVNHLRNFAKSEAIQILVMNIDSFSKDINVINQWHETGIRPIEYLQQCRPIVIMDEPQNMETEVRKRAIAHLNPLFTLRYSATHKQHYHLLYRLDPVKAYDLGLVKQIEVDAITTKNQAYGPFISLDQITPKQQSISAKITIFVKQKTGLLKKQMRCNVGDNLYQLSKFCDFYRDGFVVNEIDARNENISFSNGQTVLQGEASGGLTESILKAMIDATVENHVKKEKELSPKGIKVLSVFFIDSVANYRQYDEKGKAIKGKFALWFEESFHKWKEEEGLTELYDYSADEVHDGYFSADKGRFKDSKEGKPSKADDETYQLIMRDKEQLLDMDTPLRFIFSHSALREGWDNPNVFQICTLNETKSELKKRQEIGRGLRLCVDQNGTRVFSRAINRLTIIANESYENFSKALQLEIEEETGIKFEGRIKNARMQQEKTEKQPQSMMLNKKTVHLLNFSTTQLIENCVSAIKTMPEIPKPILQRHKKNVNLGRQNESYSTRNLFQKTWVDQKNLQVDECIVPDFIAYIQAKTSLTRSTITQMVLQSNRVAEVLHNPQVFMDQITQIIQKELKKIAK